MIEKLEAALEWGGTTKEIVLLIIGALAVVASLLGFNPLPFDSAWVAIVLCGVPILCEAAIGLITEFDIKSDVLVSLALIASVAIGEYFAAGEVAVIMQLGALLEDLTVAKARSGIERLAKVRRIMFDKTGTLTEGVLRVVAVEDARTGKAIRDEGEGKAGASCAENEAHALFSQIAAVESKSEHPLGQAVAAGYVKRFGALPAEVENFQMKPGLGVEGDVQGAHIAVGNARMMRSLGVLEFNEDAAKLYSDKGCTVSFIAINGVYRGIVALADTVRETAAQTAEALRKQDVSTIMATGDDARAASAIARATGVDEVRAECTPEDKLSAIVEMEKRGENVCMVGDGVNDAPSLKRAYVGVAMGGVGSDIAVDAADIVLVSDEVESLPHALALSRRMMTTIKLNLTFSLTLNFVAIILAITGIMGPVVGALVHNCGSVLVIANSALLLNWKLRAE